MMLPIKPKTDWRPDEYENCPDWNRQNTNITHVATITLPGLGYSPDNTPIAVADESTLPLIDLVNTLEGNLAMIEASGLPMPLGWEPPKVWAPGPIAPSYADWNRWERNIALLEEMADRMHRIVDLGWALGIAHIGQYGGL